MTSRVSFPKLIIETLRRHIAIVLITVLGFFIHILTFFMNVQNIVSSSVINDSFSFYKQIDISTSEFEYIVKELNELSSPNLWNGIFAMLFAAYFAFDFMRYMHSKKETDFYDSLPIKRQTWFKAIFLSCFILFSVLCVITIGIETTILYGTGYGSMTILKNMVWNFVCMIISFLVTWFTTALVIILTGHSIIAFLGFGVLSTYVPFILANLIPIYSARFFDTYVHRGVNDIFYYFSPVTLIYKMTNAWSVWKLNEHWTYIIGCIIYTIVICIISYFLFLRRPSESAGRAMAFEKANSTIRFLIVIPLALYAGLFLEEMATMTSTAWLLFGVVFCAFLLHGIMECIFNFDIRALLSKKKQLLITILFCLAFIFIFWTDLVQYDEYIPNAKNVKIVKIESHLFGYNDSEIYAKNDWLQGEYVAPAIKVIEDIKNAKKPSDDEYYNMDYMTVTYVMKNGLEVKRAYSYDTLNAPKSLCELYANEEFKDDICILYNIDKSKITSFKIDTAISNQTIDLSDEEMNEFIDIFLDEYSKFEFTQLFTEKACYEFCIELKADDMDYYNGEWYYIYPSFTKTISFLEEKGISDFYNSDAFTITNMEIFETKYNDSRIYVSDPDKLIELKQHMIIDQFSYHIYNDEYVYAEIELKSEEGIRYLGVYIKQSDLDKVLK